MRLLAGALTGIATAAAVLVPTAAHAAAPYTAVTINGGAESYVMSSGSRVFNSDNANITVANPGHLAALFRVSTAQEWWDVYVAPPTGTDFVVGQRYENAGVSVSGVGRGCGVPSGSWIVVHELVRDTENSEIVSFAASYSVTCERALEPNTGEIRYNSRVGYSAATVDPGAVGFGAIEVSPNGPQRTVTVKAAGSEPSTFEAASLGGISPTDYTLVADGCRGRTLTPGQTCSLTVKAHPRAAGTRIASLWLPSGESGIGILLTTDAFTGATGTYYQLAPARIMDTRNGTGVRRGAIGQRGVVSLPVTGRGGVPSTGVSAVVLNVTVTAPTAGSYLTVYPTGQARPTASSLNYPKGWTGANLVTVPVGTGGKVDFYNHSGSAHAIADVVGFYASDNTVLASRGLGGQLVRTVPGRLFDSRSLGGEGKLDAGWMYTIPVDFGEDNSRIRALAVNITAVQPDGNGYLTAWNGQNDPPNASTVNFSRGRTVPNMAIVPTAPCNYSNCAGLPAIGIYNGGPGGTHIIVDIVGFFDDSTKANGLRFKPLKPTRIVDSRSALGLPGAVGNNATATVTTPSTVAGPDTAGLALNVTAVWPTEGTYLTVWPAGVPGLGQPGVSNLNVAQGQTVPNAVITGIGPADGFHVYNSRGSTHVLVDVAGTFEWPWGSEFGSGAGNGVRAATPEAPRLSTDLPRATKSAR